MLPLTALPLTREDYETALRAAGTTSWKQGYLPYSIVADWQQLVKDFTYWRVDDAGARMTHDAGHRVWLRADRDRREQQILIDIGLLSHFVGDGSMPLHVSVHYNGWGQFPNPNNYTQERVHVPWEGVYVQRVVTPAAVAADMRPFQDCACPIEQRVGAYLMDDNRAVIPFYELQKAGAFQPGAAKGVEFTTARVAAGATELRDEILLAWRASATGKVGYNPEITVSDVESGQGRSLRQPLRRRLMATPQFGDADPAHAYRDRPAAFGVLMQEGNIALVTVKKPRHPAWFDLPGGAIDPGEDGLAAVVREFGEETGLVVEAGVFLGRADQFFTTTEGEARNNRQALFEVRLVGGGRRS